MAKTSCTYELNDDQKEWLDSMTGNYSLKDSGKALRIVLDHAIHEADHDHVFKRVRCKHCRG